MVGIEEKNGMYEALKRNLKRLIEEVRSLFDLSPEEISGGKIRVALYEVKSNGRIPARHATRDGDEWQVRSEW